MDRLTYRATCSTLLHGCCIAQHDVEPTICVPLADLQSYLALIFQYINSTFPNRYGNASAGWHVQVVCLALSYSTA